MAEAKRKPGRPKGAKTRSLKQRAADAAKPKRPVGRPRKHPRKEDIDHEAIPRDAHQEGLDTLDLVAPPKVVGRGYTHLKYLSIAMIQVMTEQDPVTIRNKLRKADLVATRKLGRTFFFDSAAALRACIGGQTDDFRFQQARLAEAKAETERLKIAQARKELIPWKDLYDHLADKVVTTRQNLLTLHVDVGQQLTLDFDQVEIVRNVVRKRLEQIAAWATVDEFLEEGVPEAVRIQVEENAVE